MEWKKNIPLIVGLSLPVLMIVLVAASIYLPSLWVKPQYNFLYQTGGNYYTRRQYVVDDGKLVKREIKEEDTKEIYYEPARTRDVTLYVHDVVKNESREVSFEAAQQLRLDPNQESPDGFTVTRGSYAGDIFGLLGGGSRENKQYLKTKTASIELNLKKTSGDAYYSDFQFLGWIIN